MTFTLADLIGLAKKKQNSAMAKNGQSEPKRAKQSVSPRPVAQSAQTSLEISSEIRDGEEVLILREPGFNYKFARGFYYHEVVKAGKSWKWDPKEQVRIIPAEDIELLLKGLRSTYEGSRLIMGTNVIQL